MLTGSIFARALMSVFGAGFMHTDFSALPPMIAKAHYTGGNSKTTDFTGRRTQAREKARRLRQIEKGSLKIANGLEA